MSYLEFNQKFRNFSFLALGVLMPFSASAISIFMILLIIGVLLDKSSYQKIYHHLKTPLFQSFALFFVLHMVGFFWLEVESINWHKSWMVWMIPILAVAVDRNIARKGVYAFVIGMMLAEMYSYFKIFSFWDVYINGWYVSGSILPISHIAYNPYLAISIGILLTTLLADQHKNIKLIFAIIFLITMVANMFMTGGRAGQLGFVFIWIAISYYYLRHNASSFSIMVILLVCILFIMWNTSPVFKGRALRALDEVLIYQDYVQNSLKTTKKNSGTSVGLRLHYKEHSLKLFKESPIYGYGTGSFENTYNNYADNSKELVFKTSNPHSNHMIILVQFGIVGFLIYLNIFYQQIRAAKRISKDYVFRPMAFVLPLFFILISFYDSYIWSHHTQALFAYLTVIFYRLDLVQENTKDNSLDNYLKYN